MKCNFIGIGVQKGASTWVYRVLDDHPEALVSQPKELDFFSMHYEKGSDWYESHFQKQDKSSIAIGEISPSYFNSREAIVRAKKYNPNLKIVVTLRDPIKRAYSNHLHLIRIKRYSGKDNSFETGMKINPIYLERSKYYTHLKEWFKVFPREQILVLIQEDILQNPMESTQKLYDFLGINCLYNPLSLRRKANVSYSEKYKGFDWLFKKIGRGLRGVGLATVVSKVKSLQVIIKIREKNQVHLNTIVPKMNSDTENFLMNELSEEVLQLAELLQVESFPWKTWEYAKQKKLSC